MQRICQGENATAADKIPKERKKHAEAQTEKRVQRLRLLDKILILYAEQEFLRDGRAIAKIVAYAH